VQAEAYVAVCRTLIDKARVEEAVEVLSKVIAAQPQVTEARYLLGRCIATLNQEAQERRTRVRQLEAVANAGPPTTAGMLQTAVP
jgi:Flp pilus assembly protein TadD